MSTEGEFPEDKIREAIEIANRAIVLHSLVASAHGVDKSKLLKWLRSEGLESAISPVELAFLSTEEPAQQEQVNASWRVEALVVIAWAVGSLPDLDPLTDHCDSDRIIAALPVLGTPTAEFIESAKRRNDNLIDDEYEKVYQAHWSVRDAQLNGRDVPDGLNPGVVRERHHAFNWVIGYMGQEWDDITCDT